MIKKNLHWFIVLLFAANCARQTSPTGGPKDTIPPKLTSANPAHRSTNFKGKSIELNFDEDVQLENAKEQVIIAPTIGKDFDIIARRDKVIIDLDKPLAENTTYTINFRESVKDLTEKNPAKNLLLAFSTGSYLDSLSIKGTVTDLLKGTELKEITVAISHPNDTFNILKHPATIITKSNDKGQYVLNYLKPSEYYVYAIDDKNRNLYVDSKTEMYGFIARPINLSKDSANVNIKMVKLDARPLKLTSTRPYNTYYNIKLSKSVKDFEITTQDGTPVYYAGADAQSTIKVYNTFKNADSTKIRLIAHDSLQNTLDTTLYTKFATREVTKEKYQQSLNNPTIISSKAELTATLEFNKPIYSVNYDSIFFRHDSLTVSPITANDITWNKTRTTAHIQKKLDKAWFPIDNENTSAPVVKQKIPDTTKTLQIKNEFFAGKATFISADQDSSTRISQQIQPLQPSTLSQIFYTIITNEPNLIVQLLAKDGRLIKEKYDTKKSSFDDLQAGDYMIRVIIDRNKNHEWDPGNLFKHQEPESVYYMKSDKSQSFNLKANWELELTPLLIKP